MANLNDPSGVNRESAKLRVAMNVLKQLLLVGGNFWRRSGAISEIKESPRTWRRVRGCLGKRRPRVGRSACDRKGTIGRKKYGRRRILVSWRLQSARVLRKNGAVSLENRRSGLRDEDNSCHVPPERYKLRKLALRCHRVSRLICKLERRLRVNSTEVCREEMYDCVLLIPGYRTLISLRRSLIWKWCIWMPKLRETSRRYTVNTLGK